MIRTCTLTGQPFEIRQEDLKFLEEISPVFQGKKYPLPAPDLCPTARMQVRLAQRNERFLYHRKCDLSGKQIISCYSLDKPFPVYENDEWYSDKWDGKEYGMEFDFTQPFFEQFGKLRARVPRLARILEKPYENSDYCNTASQVKNCYLLFSSNQNEDCYFGSWVNQCRSCVDSLNVENCELCYECVGCRDCYALRYGRDCIGCRESFFLRDCQGCSNCFGCTNQVNKQYMVFNAQKTKEEYKAFLKGVNIGSYSEMEQAKEKIESLLGDPIVKEYHGTNLEHCSGDYLRNCRNAYRCYEANNIEDCSYCQCLQNCKTSMDQSYWGQGTELIYFTQACGYNCYHILFSNICWSECSNLLYCDHCFSCRNCFGCVGLRKDEYCIFNKQYSKEEYGNLAGKIIGHMQKTPLRSPSGSFAGYEWGQYIPPSLSIYAYNETLAQEQVPLTREEVLKRGWLWLDEEEQEKQYMGPPFEQPDTIDGVTDSICNRILHCKATGKPYKIIPQELKFYKQMNIPIPRLHPDERHRRRLQLRNPRQLWERECAKCGKEIETTYAPERPEIVYCESCYLQTVH